MDARVYAFLSGYMSKQAESEAMTKAKGKFDPSLFQMLPGLSGKAYENMGRARAVLDANDEEVPFYLRKPGTAASLAALAGGVVGGAAGAGIGGLVKGSPEGVGLGGAIGGGLGALTSALVTMAVAIQKSKEVKQALQDKELKSTVSSKDVNSLEHVDTLKRRNKALNLLLGMQTGGYDAGFADQLKTMQGDTSGKARAVSGYVPGIVATAGAIPSALAGIPNPTGSLASILNAVNQNAAQNALRDSK